MTTLPSIDPLNHCLKRAHELMESPTFKRDSAQDASWHIPFAELIIAVDALLIQARQRGQQVEFFDTVGVHGKIQDITSLIVWMRSSLPALRDDLPTQLQHNRLNRYFDQGNGYFANGCFFTTDYSNELAFFIDDQRIYLQHHIGRLIQEVEAYQPVGK
ncbi:hypothetical protein ACFPMF_15635 [Larkinella bovis]|uniref:DinB family protein n=1 Tax=Larkinella bovis TaxID=683041 RepID=A0ABW0IBT1_9BACT